MKFTERNPILILYQKIIKLLKKILLTLILAILSFAHLNNHKYNSKHKLEDSADYQNTFIRAKEFIKLINPNLSEQQVNQIVRWNLLFAQEYNCDINLALAIQATETHFDWQRKSKKGAISIWQIMPINLKRICKLQGWNYSLINFSSFDSLQKQIEAGYIWLNMLNKKHKSNQEVILCEWNSGTKFLSKSKVNRHIIHVETKNFINQVKINYSRLS